MTRAVIRKADRLVADAHTSDAGAELRDDSGQIRTLAARKRGGKDLANQPRTHRRFAGVDASSAYRHEHLVGPGLRTRYLAHLEPTVAVVRHRPRHRLSLRRDPVSGHRLIPANSRATPPNH